MERILDVAQSVFEEYKKISGKTIDEMKLQKLLYLIQRESFAILGRPMFREQFEGWKYGPICTEVRSRFTDEGMYIPDGGKRISPENMYIVKNVLMQYGAIESWKLSELSHAEISWKKARVGLLPGQNGSRFLDIEDIRKDAEKVRPYDSVWDMYYDEFEDAEVC